MMRFHSFIYMRILQISTAVPDHKYSTLELLEAFPCQIPESVQRNILNLGVAERYLADQIASKPRLETVLSEVGLVDLCTESCRDAMENAGLTVESIGYFIAAYDVNPFLCPGLSQLLIRKIGFDPYIKHVNVQGMACAAFAKTLELARDHLAAHPEEFVLICLSAINSYWFHNQVQGLKNVMAIDRINSIRNEHKRCVELRKWIATMEFFLFGDGVSSLVVGKEGAGLTLRAIGQVTNLRQDEYLAGYTRLAASHEPFRFSLYSYLDRRIPELGVEYISKVIDRMCGENRARQLKAYKKWAIHTGSKKILKSIADRYGIKPEKLEESFDILRNYGNLAGVSLPFILHEISARSRLTAGDSILSLGYGWGFSASGCSLEVEAE
jgi:predicted naringenin-chalcone synthase